MRLLTQTLKKELEAVFNTHGWEVEESSRLERTKRFDVFANIEIPKHAGFDILELIVDLKKLSNENALHLDAFLVSSFQSKTAKTGSKICYSAQVVFQFEEAGL